MASYKMPVANEIASMLEMFIPNGVEVQQIDGVDKAELSHAAIFNSDDGNVVGLCCCDLPLAAALGASLSMLPPGVVEEMIAEGKLTSTSEDNIYEVMNMFSSLFMDDNTAHLKLTKVGLYADAPDTSEDFNQIAFNLDTGNYGKGSIVFSAI